MFFTLLFGRPRKTAASLAIVDVSANTTYIVKYYIIDIINFQLKYNINYIILIKVHIFFTFSSRQRGGKT